MQPKKSLGQNFLNDTNVLEKIIQASALNSDDFIIEIGPGQGILTEQLAKYSKEVVAVELDAQLINPLRKKFENVTNIDIIHADILNINLPELLAEKSIATYKVIANIPYYITSPIIRLFLEQSNQPEKIILMVQKEVAERIVAKPGQASLLSISVQYYAQAEIMLEVDKTAFSPVPKVNSAVIKIIPTKRFSKLEDKAFFKVVKAGFSAKRKTLLNNFVNSFQIDKKTVEEKLKTARISPTARAQELSIAKWQNLVNLF